MSNSPWSMLRRKPPGGAAPRHEPASLIGVAIAAWLVTFAVLLILYGHDPGAAIWK
jgi:hypothetical protein